MISVTRSINIDLFDADKMVDDFGKMIPAFFFRFVWEESNPYIYIYI